MGNRISTNEYFKRPESNRPAELAHGFVREPPSPTYGHQKVIGRLFQLLCTHVQERHLGEIVLSPMDVVLDKDADLIVQPDLMFISNERSSIIQNHIGAHRISLSKSPRRTPNIAIARSNCRGIASTACVSAGSSMSASGGSVSSTVPGQAKPRLRVRR
jgi:putative restriction endonuclease